MQLSELATGMFAFDFKFYCTGHADQSELYTVTIMANSESEAIGKFCRNVPQANTTKGYRVIAR